MKIKYCYIIFFVLFSFHNAFAQEEEDELKVTTEEVAVKKKKRDRKKERREKRIQPYEPLAPARAAFYSAVLPGLGQAYTKKYWKIPIVYAAIGTGIYFYLDNNRNYNDFRDIFKRRLAGFTDDRFINQQTGEILVSNEQLISLQERFRRDQELSLLLTVAAYLLNIVDANVTAHLQQYNITDDLSLKPGINFNEFDLTPNYGVTLNFNF